MLKLIPVVVLVAASCLLPTYSGTVEIKDLTLVDEKRPKENFLAQNSVVHTSDGSVVHMFNNVGHTSNGSVVHTFSNVAHTSDGSVVHTFNNVGHTSNGNVIHSPFGRMNMQHSAAVLPQPNVAIGSVNLKI